MLILTAACFVAMTLAVILAGAHPADGAVRDTLLALNTPVVVAVMRVITQLGHAWFLLPAMAVLLAVFAEARTRWWIWVGVMVLAPIAEATFKALIGRPRPFDPSFGFPSGHATAAATFFGAVIYLAGALRPPARTWVRVLAGLAIVLVGLSRVMLRAHWPSDVIGGVALGLALASAAALLGRPPRPAEA
jgi:membrane-associated phospholipid phosphatase